MTATNEITPPSSPRDSGRGTAFISETPRSVRVTAQHNIPFERLHYASQMDEEIVQVPFQSFIDNYAPFAPTALHVQTCFDVLLKAEQLVRSEDGRLFFAACDGKPSSRFSKETAYEFLSTICDTIGTAVIEGRKISCRLEQRPRNTTDSEITGASHMVDGYFRPLHSTVPADKKRKNIPTADIIVNCEWKLEDTNKDVVDNRRKVVSSASHNMNNDPRRQYTYSITIEDDSMTLWYWSRSHSAKSEAFEFTTDIDSAVRAFASFIFASMKELGYDGSVRRVQDASRQPAQLALVFRVQDRFFKTLRSISEHLGICITGRATRVFEVIEVRSFEDLTVIGKKSKVLKDVWLDTEARTERQIQNAIFEELDELAGRLTLDDMAELPRFYGTDPEEKALLLNTLREKRYRQQFLTIECDEQGSMSNPLPGDAVPVSGLFAPVAPLTLAATLSNGDKSRASQASEAVSTSTRKKNAPPPRKYAPKRQYRVVFEEVCQALHKLDDLHTVLTAMKDCLLAVQLLFLIGWVHRDISSGNLLWRSEQEGGRGILSDLEYAKKFDPDLGPGSPDPKTGTPLFMAVEIQLGASLALMRPDHPERLGRQLLFAPATSEAKDYNLAHNFQHDIESFFWLLLWTVTARIDSADLQKITDPMFQLESGCSTERHLAISRGLPEEEIAGALPVALRSFARFMNLFSNSLCNAYKKRDSQARIRDVTTYSWLYGLAREVLDACLEVASGPDVPKLITYSTRQDQQSKQSRSLEPGSRKRTRGPTGKAKTSFKSQKSSETRSKPRERGL